VRNREFRVEFVDHLWLLTVLTGDDLEVVVRRKLPVAVGTAVSHWLLWARVLASSHLFQINYACDAFRAFHQAFLARDIFLRISADRLVVFVAINPVPVGLANACLTDWHKVW